ncbi:lysozyme [Paenibacillus sophorae]|uniref:Lysozyme n=1 Tax=Paenibacillus sophorae TaxID=1333845 RepID=A0A1H8L6W0_9BACL|nr:glycoside hydrolase family 25 protein [Paenibacillus sophorae]QWU17409.1 glycoside hydrolase family 25 protein [Paenibacillus sophorae]SEO00835.1 lysozyme [Paenibacillus sophorae]
MQARNSKNAQGIDISHHNGPVDWAKVKADGISFAFLKASEGQTYRDDTFAVHVKAARAVGVLVGAYHFVRAVNEADAKAEAANFFAAIEAAGGMDVLDLPPVMDYENNPGGISKARINAIAAAFLLEIEQKTGVRPIVYTGNSFAANFAAAIGKYPLWVARYSKEAPTEVTAWPRWDFWQYSDGQNGGERSGGGRKVAGVSGYVDLNEYAGTVAELKARFTKTKGAEVKVAEGKAERDIDKVSGWAKDAWEEMQENGYFDGIRPGAPITREETSVVLNKLRGNFLKLIAGNVSDIEALKRRLTQIEKGE